MSKQLCRNCNMSSDISDTKRVRASLGGKSFYRYCGICYAAMEKIKQVQPDWVKRDDEVVLMWEGDPIMPANGLMKRRNAQWSKNVVS